MIECIYIPFHIKIAFFCIEYSHKSFNSRNKIMIFLLVVDTSKVYSDQ